MRARNIKPGFFKNEFLSELDPLARILFAGLWCMADKEGFVEYRPKRIKVEILPYDSCNVEKLLEELCSAGFIKKISLKGVTNEQCAGVILVNNFSKHQNPHKNEKPSELSKLVNFQEITGKNQKKPEIYQTDLADSLIPDSLIPETYPPTPQGADPPISPATKPQGEYTQEFETWYKHYPAKKGKDAAFRSWQKIKKSGRASPEELTNAIISQVRNRHFTNNRNEDFIPNPATWLNQGRWKDEIKCGVSGINWEEIDFGPNAGVQD